MFNVILAHDNKNGIGNNNEKTIYTTETYICGLRLKQDQRKMVKIQSLSLVCVSNGDIEYTIYLIKSPIFVK